MSPEGRPRVALIAGPTASGKSALALRMARATGGVIVNADSAQVYRDLRILSARPTPDEEARAPHRLYGHVDGADPCSAAQWAGEAEREIDLAHADGRLPILVGGTGLYIRTLLDGIAPVPEIDPAIRADVRALPVEAAYTALLREDPAAAARLAPRDTTRIARALEVARATGRSVLDWRAERSGGISDRVALEPLVLAPPPAWVYARADRRAAEMLASGAVEEVVALLERQLDPALPVRRAIGVRPIVEHVEGKLTRDEALDQIRHDTGRYVKRQQTWARHQYPANWPRRDMSGASNNDG